MQSQQLVAANFCLAKAGLTGLSGAATTFTTGAALLASIVGKAVSKAAVAGAAAPTVDGVTGLPIVVKGGFGTNVLWAIDINGNVFVVKGSTEVLDASGNFQYAPPQFAMLPDNLVAFAYSVHKNAAGSADFTFGVSAWNQAGMTNTATDLIAIPNRPQSA